MTDHVIVDCTSGEQRTVPLTDDEVAERESRTAVPEPVDRVALLEARLDEVAALAEQANVTAQDVAEAARPPR